MEQDRQPPKFVMDRDRDAWAAVRGFAYQVDRTVEHWLRLEAGQILELERGEDIDLVERALSSPDEGEARRYLEQIKYREKNVSLATAEAREFLANSVDHMLINPKLDLRFRFSTNASPGVERKGPFPGVPGILVWQRLARSESDASEATKQEAALLTFLRTAKRPKEFWKPTWEKFTTFLSGVDEAGWRSFVARVDWCTAQPDAVDYRPRLTAELVERGFAPDPTEATALCDALVSHVWRLLSHRGIKRLSASDLATVVAGPRLGDADRAKLARLASWTAEAEARIAALEGEQPIIKQGLADLSHRFDRLAEDSQFSITAAVIPDLSIPAPLPNVAPRAALVQRLRSDLDRCTWLALSGATGMGKSQLASLVARNASEFRGWLQLNPDAKPEAAAAMLDVGLAGTVKATPALPAIGWYRTVCAKLGAGALLVIDDLPAMSGDDGLSKRLLLLVEAAASAELRILTTSQYELPPSIRQRVHQGSVLALEIPGFTDEEAGELLRAFGAPDHILETAKVGVVNVRAGGHPWLLVVIAEFLRDQGWELETSEVFELLRGTPTHKLEPELLERLSRRAPAEDRKLLFRLAQAIDSFGREVVTGLAKLEPAVDEPILRLHRLLGPWIQRKGADGFMVSPLVKAIPEQLDAELIAACNAQLAHFILKTGKLDDNSAQNAFIYLMKCKAEEMAARVLAGLLKSILDHPAPWRADLPLALNPPAGAAPSTALRIRALQMAVAIRIGRSTSAFLSPIDALLETGATDSDSQLFLGLLAAVHLGPVDITRTLRYSALAVRSEGGRAWKQPHADGAERIESLLWGTVIHLRSLTDVRGWMAAVDSLAKDQQTRLFCSRFGALVTPVLSTQIVVVAKEAPSGAPDLEAAHKMLREMEAWASNLDADTLACAVVAKEFDLILDHRAIPADLEERARLKLAATSDPGGRVILARAMATSLARAGRHGDARAVLVPTVGLRPPGLELDTVLLLQTAAWSFDEEAAGAGQAHAAAAADLAAASPEMPGLEVARAAATKALHDYLAVRGQAGAHAAFAAWSSAAALVLDAESDNIVWRELVLKTATLSLYLQGRAASEEAIAPLDGAVGASIDGGVFLRPALNAETAYRAHTKLGLAWYTAEYAAACSNDEQQWLWLQRADQCARDVAPTVLTQLTHHAMLPHLLATTQHEEALERACSAATLWMGYRKAAAADAVAAASLDLTQTIASLTDAELIASAAAALAAFAVPAALQICRTAIVDPQAAETEARTVAIACRDVGAKSPESLWGRYANLLEAFAAGKMDGSFVAGTPTNVSANELPLAYAGRLLATPKVSLAAAYELQRAVVRHLIETHSPSSPMSRRVIRPYFDEFWEHVVKNKRSLLLSPALVGAEWQRLKTEYAKPSIAQMMTTVAFGLYLNATPETDQWLAAQAKAAAAVKGQAT